MKIENDKKSHFIVGFSIAVVISMLFHNVYYGLIASIIAGASKEILDMSGSGTPDFFDFVATVLGGAAAYLVLLPLYL
jgi:hypothetical protein